MGMAVIKVKNPTKGGRRRMIDTRFFANLIEEIQAEREWDRAEVAKQIGVKPNVISQYKSGRTFPDDDKLRKLATLTRNYDLQDLIAYKRAIHLKIDGLDILDIARRTCPEAFAAAS